MFCEWVRCACWQLKHGSSVTPIGRHEPPYIGCRTHALSLIYNSNVVFVTATWELLSLRCLRSQHPSASNVPLSNLCSPDVTYLSFPSRFFNLSFVFASFNAFSISSCFFFISFFLPQRIYFPFYTKSEKKEIFLKNWAVNF